MYSGKYVFSALIFTWVVIDKVFKALEGLSWTDVIPVIGEAEDPVMFHLPVPHWQGI